MDFQFQARFEILAVRTWLNAFVLHSSELLLLLIIIERLAHFYYHGNCYASCTLSRDCLGTGMLMLHVPFTETTFSRYI